MPEEKFDNVEKVLSGLKVIEHRNHGPINDLLRQKPNANRAFDEKW